MEDKYIRQQELVNQERLADLRVVIIGCGAVGSFTALSLCKMGIGHMTLIDPDKVSTENLPNQYFKEDDLGKKKVDACSDLIRRFDKQIPMVTLSRPFIKQKLEGDIVISSVDSMEVRKRVWRSIVSDKKVKLLIDPRMAAQVIQVYTASPGDPSSLKAYEATLIDETEALQDRCTARSIIYAVLPVAALVCKHVAAFANGEWIEPAITLDLKTLTMLKNGVHI